MNQFTRSNPRPRRLAIAAALSGAVLALGACSGSTGGGGTATAGGGGSSSITVFNGGTGTIAENWNPFSATALQPTLGIIYEPLFYYNLASSDEPTPELGTDFSWNDDGTELTITTREGVTWSDGEPFTAADVAYTFNLVHDTPEFNTSGLDFTAEATDDTTVVVTYPTTSFVQEAQLLGNTPIVPEHVWSQKDDPVRDINENPVGTGAYVEDSFTSQSYQLTANDNYWEEGKPSVQNVRYISLANADAASSALLAGEVDWMSSFFPGFQDLMADQDDLTWINTPGSTTSIMTCSNAEMGCDGPQTDPAVRQAIFYGVDREQLNSLAFAGLAVVPSVSELIPDRDDQWIADDLVETPSTADVQQAQQVLEDAGWTKGSDGIYAKDGQRASMTIQVVAGYSDYISAIDAMTQQLAAVGIELQSSQVSYNEWSANQSNGTFQLSMDSIGFTPSTDPYFTYNPKYASSNTQPVGESVGANNYARYSNATVDEAITAAAATDDDSVKAEQYATIQHQIEQDMPYIPLVVGSTLTEFNTSRATGWPTEDDTYAFPAAWKSWDNGIVLKNITPAGS